MIIKQTIGGRVFNVFNIGFFILAAIITLYPVWYVIMYSFSDPNYTELNSLYLLPSHFTLSTYEYVIKQPAIFAGYKNTIFITVVGTAINLLLTLATAYPFSRRKMIGKNIFFNLLLFTMLFGGGMIPSYLVVKATGLMDTLWALIIPGAFSPYYVIIMVKFIKGIPESLIESAKMDGCNDIFILFRIIMPLSTACLAAIGLFYAVGHWNEYFSGVIYINDPDKKPLQVILNAMLNQNVLGSNVGIKRGQLVTPMSMKMASVMVVLAPILVVYPFLQKYFSKGVLIGSIKG